MSQNLMFIDAETDGLYGPFLSIAAIVVDGEGDEISSFYSYRKVDATELESEWVKEHVYPQIMIHSNIKQEVLTEEELLGAFTNFYQKNDTALVVTDVAYPVESRLFLKMKEGRSEFLRMPFPLLDLSSMLYAKEIDPLTDREELCGMKDVVQHNAFDDVRMSIAIWKKYIKGEKEKTNEK